MLVQQGMLIGLSVLYGLTACGAMTKSLSTIDGIRQKASDVPVCTTEIDCCIKWERARQWIEVNSYWDIRIDDDTRMETRQPYMHRFHKAWYRVSKVSGNGVTEIQIDVRCVPSIHCSPDPLLAKDAFNRFVETGQELKLAQ